MEENERAVAAMRQFLEALGLDLQALGMEKTPHRVAQAFADFFSGLKENPDDEWQDPIATQTDGLVVVRNIRFHSMCEHHLLPFHGVAHVGYIPSNGQVAGLSKLARLVELYARRPQVQERLTQQVADALMEGIEARGVIVVTECDHMCMAMRGVKKAQSRTVTSAVRGCMRDAATRTEAMSLILSNHS